MDNKWCCGEKHVIGFHIILRSKDALRCVGGQACEIQGNWIWILTAPPDLPQPSLRQG